MGYSTEFEGELKITSDLTLRGLKKLKTYLGEDVRDHPEWPSGDNFYFINLELTEDMDALKWDTSENSNSLDKQVNYVITEMRKEFPEFGLTGSMKAQGEERGDVWTLVIGADGMAKRVEAPTKADIDKLVKLLQRWCDIGMVLQSSTPAGGKIHQALMADTARELKPYSE